MTTIYRKLTAEEFCRHQYDLKTKGVTHIDDFISPTVIKSVIQSMPDIDWHTYANRDNKPEFYNVKSSSEEFLKNLRDECLNSGRASIPYFYYRSMDSHHEFIELLRNPENMRYIGKILDSDITETHGYHFSQYNVGDYLGWHTDLEKKRSYAVIYNFSEWHPGNGGELEVIDDAGQLKVIPPICGRVSIFRVNHGTGRRHRVRQQTAGIRYACAGWYSCPGIND